MTMLKDPEMEEIVLAFCDESEELLEQLEDLLDEFEEDTAQTEKLEQFGQIIDRIMGAAKSIGANTIGRYCDLAKAISYKASQVNEPELLSIVAAVLFDTVEVVQTIVASIRSKREEEAKGINLEAMAGRLKWLSDKFSHIERGSVAVANESQESIDDLLAKLGL